ncbi:hypothetical protein GCM10023238_05700 [Streptomyces heliomycini]
MRGQLQHLIDVSERPTSGCRSCRSASAGHSGESGAFTVLSFPESDLSDVVYLEQLTSALYLDKAEDVAQYEKALKELQHDSPVPRRAGTSCGGCCTCPERVPTHMKRKYDDMWSDHPVDQCSAEAARIEGSHVVVLHRPGSAVHRR